MNNTTNKLKAFMHDFSFSIMYGCILAFGITLVITIFAFIASGLDVFAIINYVRSGLLVVSGLSFFVCAALLLLKKEKVSEKHYQIWKKRFYLFNYVGVGIVMSAVIVAVASLVDLLLFL